MKLLHLDIETAPHKVFAWGLYDQNVAINQIVEPGYTLCWAAKWHGKRGVLFDAIWKSGHEGQIRHIHELLAEADAVCHWNGQKFDIPTLNHEFVSLDIPPPATYKQIDLMLTARKQFKFASNKLDYIAQQLGMGSKIEHKGMDLWRDCMDGDPKAHRIMERYNKQDVRLLEPLYNRLLPWVTNHPNMALYESEERPCCPKCGSADLQSRGTEKTATNAYRRFQCQACGSWSRSRENCTENKEAVMARAG